jgi:2-dehydro-3-deoxygluconokinase
MVDAATTPTLVTLGETMGLFRASHGGPGELVDQYHFAMGGAESNVAIGVARLGVGAAWIGRVGDDAAGRKILRELRAEGVHSHAVVDPLAHTGLMVKEARIPGHSAVMYARAGSAGSRLDVDDVEASMLSGAGVLHVTGITPALSDSAERAVFHAIGLAADAGITVSFDVNHRSALWRGRDPRTVYRRMAARSQIVFAGEDEAELLVGLGSPDDLAERICALGPSTAVIKRGAAGSVTLSEGQHVALPATPINPVDTVGAGDAFVAGYLAELLRGSTLLARLETATRAGAFACLGFGDWESFVRAGELELVERVDPVSR